MTGGARDGRTSETTNPSRRPLTLTSSQLVVTLTWRVLITIIGTLRVRVQARTPRFFAANGLIR